MLKQYPKFRKGRVKGKPDYQINFENLPEDKQNELEDFGEDLGADFGEEKVKDYKREVLKFYLLIDDKEAFDNFNLEHLKAYYRVLRNAGFPKSTEGSIKDAIKYFLRWKYKDWSARFDDFRLLRKKNGKGNGKGLIDEKKINDKILITKEEVEKVVKRETNIFWKAFFLVSYEGGLRTKEARFLKWEDIEGLNEDREILRVHIYSTKTTQARVVFLKEAKFWLEMLKEETERVSPYVFPSKSDDNKPILKSVVSQWYKKHVSKVLGRKYWAYLNRHSRANELYNNDNIADTKVAKLLGHSEKMKKVYSHTSFDEVEKVMKDIVYNVDYMPIEKKSELEERLRKIEEAIRSIKVLSTE